MSRIDDLIAELCPDGVEFRTLGEVGIFIRGNGLQKSDLTSEGVPAIHYGQIHTYYGTSTTKSLSFVTPGFASRLRKAAPGDLVIATTSEDDEAVGKAVAWLGDVPAAVSGDAYIYRHTLDPKFVSYFFQSEQFHDQKKRSITGTKVRRVSGDSLAKIRIPLPPLEIQREIVRILDHFTELESELGAALEAELEMRRRQYQHYRVQALSLSSDFRSMPIRELTAFTNGKPHERLVSETGDIALLTSRFISTGGKSARFVDSKNVLTPAHTGDVALVMSDLPNGRALAKAYFVDCNERYAANQRVCLLTVLDPQMMNSRYLYYAIDRNSQLLAYDSGLDQTHLKKDYILDVEIPVPPLAEQERIVDILDKFDALVNDLSIGLPAELKARRKQYEYYRDRLLTFQERA